MHQIYEIELKEYAVPLAFLDLFCYNILDLDSIVIFATGLIVTFVIYASRS